MKIGILTLPLHTNYGGILQAYALQMVLERMGHEVVILDKPFRLYFKLRSKEIRRRLWKKCRGKWNDRIFREEYAYSVVSQHTRPFIRKYLHVKEVSDFSKLKQKGIEAIVVGSDQVWRAIWQPHIEHMFLSFAQEWNICRVSYAASFGTENWEYNEMQTELCGKLLRQFDAVSVREDSGVRLCREHFGVEAQHVLDPTMLLNREEYMQLSRRAGTPKSKGTLLCYMLDGTEDKQRLIQRIADQKGLIPFTVTSKVEDYNAPLEERIQPPLEQWLQGFYDAEFVVTDSFHACVFSILFRKPFIVYGNPERGMARFASLLRMFGLEDRLICQADDYAGECTPIDFEQVEARLEILREDSRAYLLKALRKSERGSE